MSGERPARRRVLVVDDHPIVRFGIRQMIDAEEDLQVCGEAESAEAALVAVRDLKPDLAIVDLSLEHGTSVELIRSLRQSIPELVVLVLSMHDETLFAERVLRAGARGYIMKREAITGLIAAIRQVLAGRIYLSDHMGQMMLARLGHEAPTPDVGLVSLTDRELEVFELIGRGLSTAEIAANLSVSVKTIETYRSNLKKRLSLKSTTDLVRLAVTSTEGL